jgi:hypothetical protein
MTSTQIIILILALLILVLLVVAVVMVARRQRLRQRFGPEYDRTVAERDSRSAAEKELRERERRHAELTLRPLSGQSREGYAREWARVQARFVDAPEEAVRDGDALVTRLVGEIGYPTENYEDQLATLSVEHARTLGHYRDAHDIFLRNERGEASTEHLRQALVHYRALFAELLGVEPVPPQPDEAQPRGDGVRRQPTPPPAARRPDEAPQPNQRSRATSHPDYR